MRVVTFKVEESLLEIIDELARARGVSRSEVIREALHRYVASKREYVRVRSRFRVRHVVLT